MRLGFRVNQFYSFKMFASSTTQTNLNPNLGFEGYSLFYTAHARIRNPRTEGVNLATRKWVSKLAGDVAQPSADEGGAPRQVYVCQHTSV